MRPTVDAPDFEKAAAVMRHPRLDRGYFDEYPLRPTGGVEHYQRAFALRQWFLVEDDDNRALERYFQHLRAHAASRRKRPVFQLCRSSGRIGWFVRHLPGVHAYILRDPRNQWTSYKRMNSIWSANLGAFIATVQPCQYSAALMQIVNRQANDRVLRAADRVRYYTRCMTLLGAEKQYFCFYYLWLFGLLNAMKHCQFILDMDLMSASPEFQTVAAAFFADRGAEVDFTDCCIGTYRDYPLSEQRMSAVEASVHRLFIRSRWFDVSALRPPHVISARYDPLVQALCVGGG